MSAVSLNGPIGVFDSGYGGLSILKALRTRLPSQSFVYLGDHKNAPYGRRTKDDLYDLTIANIDWLFRQDCRLVILACNTASSVLRRVQHEWLPARYPHRRVLGIVVPTIEAITGVTWSDTQIAPKKTPVTVGVFATDATVRSEAYPLEIHKRAPHIRVTQQACLNLVTLIESGATNEALAQEVGKYVEALRLQLNDAWPDYALLGCTHYALIEDLFRAALPREVEIIDQPACVAASLEKYLARHVEFRNASVQPSLTLLTTGDEDAVNRNGRVFLSVGEKFLTMTQALHD